MILIFLGDWRPTIVISISIPLSIFRFDHSSRCDRTDDQHHDAWEDWRWPSAFWSTTRRSKSKTSSATSRWARRCGKRFWMAHSRSPCRPSFRRLSICIVFVPMFFLTGVAKFLFVPLAEAVSFAMLASYLLSRTLIPTLVMYIMRGHEHRAEAPTSFFGRFQRGFERKFEDFRRGYEALLETTLEHRGLFAACFLIFCMLSLGLFTFLGRISSPKSMPGCSVSMFERRAGLRVEETARLCDEIEATLRRRDPSRAVADRSSITLGFRTRASTSRTVPSGTIGTSDAEILIALDPEHHPPAADLTRQLREVAAATLSRAWSSSSNRPTS